MDPDDDKLSGEQAKLTAIEQKYVNTESLLQKLSVEPSNDIDLFLN